MGKFLLFTLILGINVTYFSQLSVVNYTESSSIIANPERGLQKYSKTNSSYSSTTGYSNITENSIRNWRTGVDKVTVIYRYFFLDNFINANISQTYLDNMQIDFNRIRNAGLKVIVRFAYTDNVSASAQQPSKAQILTHINQLTPILSLNRDVITLHQAGFIGTWGEWYYTNSSEFGTEGNINTTQWNNRKDILDAMLIATPAEIPIQVRYPQIKTQLYGSTPLDSASSFKNTPQARIGFFNDAFLNNWGDMGTYSVNSEFQDPVGTSDYTFLSNETKYTPMSGESNGINTPRTDGSNAVYELNLTNFSILNRDYYPQVITNWINSGHYDIILKNLGYRFVLKSSEFNLIGNNLTVKINIENKGYANLFKKRDVNLVIVNTANNVRDTFLLNTDIVHWDSVQQINQTIDLSSLNSGNFECYLSLPDKLLPSRPEYAIQFANVNTWVDSLGLNKLNQPFSLNSVGVSRLTNTNLVKIYPNPTNNEVTISTPENYVGEINLIDASGKKIRSLKVNSTSTTISLLELNSGVYYINMILPNKEVLNEKIVLLK